MGDFILAAALGVGAAMGSHGFLSAVRGYGKPGNDDIPLGIGFVTFGGLLVWRWWL